MQRCFVRSKTLITILLFNLILLLFVTNIAKADLKHYLYTSNELDDNDPYVYEEFGNKFTGSITVDIPDNFTGNTAPLICSFKAGNKGAPYGRGLVTFVDGNISNWYLSAEGGNRPGYQPGPIWVIRTSFNGITAGESIIWGLNEYASYETMMTGIISSWPCYYVASLYTDTTPGTWKAAVSPIPSTFYLFGIGLLGSNIFNSYYRNRRA